MIKGLQIEFRADKWWITEIGNHTRQATTEEVLLYHILKAVSIPEY